MQRQGTSSDSDAICGARERRRCLGSSRRIHALDRQHRHGHRRIKCLCIPVANHALRPHAQRYQERSGGE